MEDRNGYKKTKIGWIPEEWDVACIKDITKVESKKNIDNRINKVVSVTKYDGIVDSLKYFKKQVFSKDISTYKIVKKGQFAYATIHLDEGSIGYLSIYDEAVLSPMYTVFSIDKTLIDTLFFFGLVKSNRMINIYNHIGAGSINRRKSIPFAAFCKIKIALPPLPEQKKIASILTTVDDKIESIDKQIEQTEQLKKGLSQELLTKGIGHIEFKDSKIGRIPKNWDVVKLNDISEKIIDGTHFTPNYIKEGIPFLRVTDLKNKNIDFNSIKYISHAEHTELIKRCSPKKGDILYSKNGTIGIPKLIDWNWEFSIFVSLALIKPIKNKIYNLYLKNILCSQFAEKEIKIRAKQGAVTNLHLEEIREFKIPLPPLPEQKQIASILSAVDDKIEILQSKKSKHKTLKKGLMEQLLTGQIRVQV